MAKNNLVRGTCTVPGCDRPHKSRGYCNTHAQRHWRGAEVAVAIKTRDRDKPEQCTEIGCSNPVKSKGLCKAHYARLLRHGHTKYPDRKKPPKPCTFPGCENHLYASGYCNQHYTRIRRLKDVYGLTLEAYSKMLADQGGVCACCGGPPRSVNGQSGKVTEFAVDHDHVTKKVRGLLCSHCNRGIGLFQDDPAILRRAATYLEAHAT